jgi:hypothetical protein
MFCYQCEQTAKGEGISETTNLGMNMLKTT